MSIKNYIISSIIFLLILLGCSTAPMETESPDPQQTQEILIVTPEEEIFLPPPAEPMPGEIGTEYTLYSKRPILEPESDWEEYRVSVGDVVYYDGYFHMFYGGSAYQDSSLAIGYAVSTNGYEWSRVQESPIFEAKQISYVAARFLGVSSVIIDEDGTWIMYFTVYPFEGDHPSFGRATASQPTGPWIVDPAPALSLGVAPAWDSLSIASPNIVQAEDGYRMYYSGDGPPTGVLEPGIGLATSIDGISWTKHDDPETTQRVFVDSDPVIQPGDVSPYGDSGVGSPRVIRTQDGWAMLYIAPHPTESGFNNTQGIDLAFSQDGIVWTQYESNPIFSPGDLFPEYRTGKMIWLFNGNTYFLYLTMWTPMSSNQTFLLTSEISQ